MGQAAMMATICSKTKKWFLILFDEDGSGNWGAGRTTPITESRADKGYGHVVMKNVYIRGDYGRCSHCEDNSFATCPKCQVLNCLGSRGQETVGDTVKNFFICGKCGTKLYTALGVVNLSAKDDI